ncbi:curved dna-binding protein [Fagus crenata]
MDCNKEEAIRAKGIAVKKMEAQQLHPDVENISQMLTICEVHCAAGGNCLGMRWTGMVSLRLSRQLMRQRLRSSTGSLLQLHPDKTSLQLLGVKRQHLIAPSKASWNSNVGVQNNFRSNVAGLNPQQQPQPQPVPVLFHQELQSFIAYDMNVQGPPTTNNSRGPPTTNNSRGPPTTNMSQPVGCQGNVGSQKLNGKRGRKQVEESSESFDTKSSTESEGDIAVDNDGQKFGCDRDQNPEIFTASSRSESAGATKEESGDASKEEASKANNSSDIASNVKENLKDMKQNESAWFEESLPNGNMKSKVSGKETVADDNCKKTSEAHDNSTVDPEFFQYPDSDFSDFDNDRKQECFKAGQIWAVYDNMEAMPRFYAHIKKVFSPGFKVRITWLEPDPGDEDEIKWFKEDLPTSCGLSKKGETWALFKNWDIKWYSEPDQHRKCEYEFVEILSDFAQDVGIRVAYLGKKWGISSSTLELFRFSHRVPSFEMTGEERQGLYLNLEEFVVPVDVKVEAGANASMFQTDYKRSHLEPGDSTSPIEAIEIQNLNSTTLMLKNRRSFRSVRFGRYSDEDGLPKYYGQIMKIGSGPVFKLHLTWLSPASCQTTLSNGMMKTCPFVYNVTTSFSHQVRADPVGKRNEYAIFPRKGEVWALYKNWTPKIKCSDLENCEYDLVEVEEEDLQIKVLFLERVDGFNSVFKAQIKEGSEVTIGIPRIELLRFSHQLPAFRLTKEKGGRLRGFWELDPAALPVHYFS